MNRSLEPVIINESCLLEKMRQDDSAAFQSLFNHYWLPLYKTAYRRLNDRQEAEDIVQEVLASIWQRRASITTDANGSLQSYLFTALRYRIISFYAQVKPERFQGEVLERLLQLQAEDQFARLVGKELQQLLRNELDNMPQKMQQAYQLTRNDHFSVKEVAVQLELSEQTVKNLLTTSSKRMRGAIEKYYSKDPSRVLTAVIIMAISRLP